MMAQSLILQKVDSRLAMRRLSCRQTVPGDEYTPRIASMAQTLCKNVPFMLEHKTNLMHGMDTAC